MIFIMRIIRVGKVVFVKLIEWLDGFYWCGDVVNGWFWSRFKGYFAGRGIYPVRSVLH